MGFCAGYGFCFEGPNGGQGNPPGFGAALYTCSCYTSGCQVNFDSGHCIIRSALQAEAGNTTHMDETPAQVAPAQVKTSEATHMDESPAQVTPTQVKTSETAIKVPLSMETQASCDVPKKTKATSTTTCSKFCKGYGFCFEGPHGGQGDPPRLGAAKYSCSCYTSGCRVSFDSGRCNIRSRSALQSAAPPPVKTNETTMEASLSSSKKFLQPVCSHTSHFSADIVECEHLCHAPPAWKFCFEGQYQQPDGRGKCLCYTGACNVKTDSGRCVLQ